MRTQAKKKTTKNTSRYSKPENTAKNKISTKKSPAHSGIKAKDTPIKNTPTRDTPTDENFAIPHLEIEELAYNAKLSLCGIKKLFRPCRS